MEQLAFYVVVFQVGLLYAIFRMPRTAWHGWKMAQWFKANLEPLDRDAGKHMTTMWFICKHALRGFGVMLLTLFMNSAFGHYIDHCISNNIHVADPTLIAIFALSNTGCFMYALRAHKDDTLINEVWDHYNKRTSSPWPPKML